MSDKILKLYSTDEYGNIHESRADKGFYGEDVYNPRECSPEYPPNAGGKIAVIDEVSLRWKLIDDNRGTWYDKETGAAREIQKPADAVDGLTRKKPANEFQKWDAASGGGAWVFDAEKKKSFDDNALLMADEKMIADEMRKMIIASLGNKLKVVTK